MFVCWFVGLSAFYRPHDICPLLRRCLRVSERAGAVAGSPARAGKHAQCREHARACRTTAQRKNRCTDAFKNKTVRACACCRIRNCRDFPKKGKKKTNMPLPKFSLQFAFSWSVYFSNRAESYSSQIELDELQRIQS